MPPSRAEPTHPRRLEIEFGRPSACVYCGGAAAGLRLPVPVLGGGDTRERLWADAAPAGVEAGFDLYTSGDLLIGCAARPVGPDLRATAHGLYLRLLDAAGGGHLYRVWNYVPGINGSVHGLENYRAFCAGRSLAFERRMGSAFQHQLPAASAVGCDGGSLAVIFVAGREEPSRFENPEQVPAYEYPPEYGPRPPSFARATVAQAGGRRLTFIAGTAAIKGHATVAPDRLPDQLACTIDNLRLIGRACGAGDDLGLAAGASRSFKVYVRRSEDFNFVRSRLMADFFRPSDHVVWLRADLCRASLRVEIEATLVG